jgi:hypothetical protein
MKNVIAITALMFSLFSCQKETKPDEKLNTEQLMLNRLHNIVFDNVHSEQYYFTVYDSCAQENINLGGLETYKLKETGYTNAGYFIYYEIDLTGITGTGEKSGIAYKGGGVSTGMVQISQEFSHMDTLYSYNWDGTQTTSIDSIFVVSKVIGRDTYKTKFTSTRDEISFTMKNVYKEINGKVIIDHTGNLIEIACKRR